MYLLNKVMDRNSVIAVIGSAHVNKWATLMA